MPTIITTPMAPIKEHVSWVSTFVKCNYYFDYQKVPQHAPPTASPTTHRRPPRQPDLDQEAFTTLTDEVKFLRLKSKMLEENLENEKKAHEASLKRVALLEKDISRLELEVQ